MGLIPGSKRSPGVENGNPLQYPCLGNPMDRGAWWATVLGVTKVIQQAVIKCLGFPGGSAVKNPPAIAGDEGSIPGSGRSPGVENGNPLQYPCLGNFMERGAWRVAVYGVT